MPASPSASGWPGWSAIPDVAYVAAFAARSADKPIDISAGPAAPLIMKMRDRMSFMRTREIRDARLKQGLDRGAAAPQCLGDDGAGRSGTKPVVLPELLAERGWSDLDYIKLDVDGADFDILQILRRALRCAAA